MGSPYRTSPGYAVVSILATAMLAGASLTSSDFAAAEPAPDIRLARYTTVAAAPDIAQIDPLEAIVQVELPTDKVSTVGDAIAYLLLRIGYRLAPQKESDQAAHEVLAMPLPDVHRQVGPYSVRTALSVLVGSPFSLSVDRIRRSVAYRVAIPAGNGNPAIAGAVDQVRSGSER